ncbi:MerR family transcriptional regulator [Planctomicrobium sp. SH527]|uniref:MerR family transcriptional regulator n=1 Tax=Planctomicrobium sp. SH527 TaxID=3448123 RepID=UPI003F5BE484
MTQLYLISDVAEQLGIQAHRIAYLLMTRKIEEPKLRLGNRRIFTDADAHRVADALGLAWESGKEAHG